MFCFSGNHNAQDCSRSVETTSSTAMNPVLDPFNLPPSLHPSESIVKMLAIFPPHFLYLLVNTSPYFQFLSLFFCLLVETGPPLRGLSFNGILSLGKCGYNYPNSLQLPLLDCIWPHHTSLAMICLKHLVWVFPVNETPMTQQLSCC